MITAAPTDLLLVIDVQRDYFAPGPVAVPDADGVIAPINRLIAQFDHVAATQEWHPKNHVSFASANPNCGCKGSIFLPECNQTLWPDHCVQGTRGAQFHSRLHSTAFEFILRRGTNPAMDARSAFFESDGITPTGLAGYMDDRGFRRLICVGLPLDSTVRFTAEDACRMDFEAVVVIDACRAIYGGVALDDSLSMMVRAGITLATTADIGLADACAA